MPLDAAASFRPRPVAGTGWAAAWTSRELDVVLLRDRLSLLAVVLQPGGLGH